MHVRRNINLLIQRSGYQVVRIFPNGAPTRLPPEVLLEDSMLELRIAPHRKHAWIIAAPKSGSKWLSTVLQTLLGWRTVALWRGSPRREQEPDPRQLLRFPGENIFSPHQHCRASESTVDFIKRFRIKPVIQVRNAYDTIVSFRDHCVNTGFLFPMAYIDREFLRYDQDKQLQFIIDLVMPWYFNFYASWFQVEGLSPGNLLFVNYDELLGDPRTILAGILDYLGEVRQLAEIERALAKAETINTGKNKAVSGRGNCLLTDRHKARIRELRQFYAHIDFSRVGL